jgi:tetratricopeptide (TPR) repeat protein
MNTIVNKIKLFLLLSAVLWFAFQAFHKGSFLEAEPLNEKDKPEVISLLGKKLYAAPAEGEELLKLQNELKEAIQKVEADPENPEHLILYGRRLAYLWKYHEAIDVYTRGIKIHPDQAMLYRHRGHRYISVRKFDLAVKDLTKASELNDHDFDIWYHLGLAHYLKGEFENALWAYQNCLKSAQDDDSKIAISNWLYITLQRLGRKEEAAETLDGIKEGMGVVENQSYYELLFFYKGLKSEAEIEALAEVSDLDMATIGYGIGCWNLYNNNTGKAKAYFEKIMNGRYWPAFGFIAAEAELFRLKE